MRWAWLLATLCVGCSAPATESVHTIHTASPLATEVINDKSTSTQTDFIVEPNETKQPESVVPEVQVAPVQDVSPRGSSVAASGGAEQWRALVSSIMPADTVDRWLRVIQCESGGHPDATGAAGERGLTQIHPLHFDSTYDPEANIRAAFRISGGGYDFGPWSCKG